MTAIIKLNKVEPEKIKKLFSFFGDQTKQGKMVWKEGVIYQFEDHESFQFGNDVFQRQSQAGNVRYEEISKKKPLGKGAYGEVKLIKGTTRLDPDAIEFKKQNSNGERMVVKIQTHTNAHNPLPQLYKEHDITKQAGHLNIKSPTVVQKEDGSHVSYMVMRNLSGCKLSDIIDGQVAITLQQRIDLSKALLKALKEQVTDKNIVHRDIKDDNIKVDLGPPIVVNIYDYGLSMKRNESDGRHVGCPNYFAPEVMHDALNVNEKADVFSMARVLALLWNVDYYSYMMISTYDYYTMALSNNPDDRTCLLDNLCGGIVGLSDENKAIIKATLTGMLEPDPKSRLSIEQAIEQFDRVMLANKSKKVSTVPGNAGGNFFNCRLFKPSPPIESQNDRSGEGHILDASVCKKI
ncbi:protein kinase domain-containing protein [Legionella spiritensis]|uniref:Serine/threonine-protein kinase n=1 Tax=Legionella spiritensis TaxID=452 RepID=A0A0W0YY65_LEGSP|nr:protein kinase [Legionella spiritensis]KTD61566.1 serine/threonine-protein kinase [Legionella spiritensis]SNV32443.1 serine/threonine-protein kinase [Legionella spiritensis]